jgi:hypothetical protein
MIKITIIQMQSLIGKAFDEICYFNPVQDVNGDWFISIEEVNNCTNPNFQWVKELNESEFIPKINEIEL